MAEKPKTPVTEKNGLHPRNLHRQRYDFDALTLSCPELKPFVSPNKFGDISIDFANPEAVKMLNRALLQHFYGISNWDIPEGYLCPPIPGRADYLHNMADLLAESNEGVIPLGTAVRVLDIGVGANCVYPIIGNHQYGWQFTGSDIDAVAIRNAKQIAADNTTLAIELRQQTNPSNIYKGIIAPDEFFDIAICNPPFHASLQKAQDGTLRKLNNLGLETGDKPVLNFGGQNAELWYPGGEAAFISKMIYQSSVMPRQCFWYSTLVSKRDNLPAIYKALKKAAAFDVRTIDMAQGQKQSRIVAWTFLDDYQQSEWCSRWE